jgi:hypothetical protein
MTMHSFVITVCKPDRTIPQHVLELLRQTDTPDLCFVPADHKFWSDESQRVAFAGWSKVTQIGDVGSYWHTGDRGLTAFAGRMWPNGRMWHPGSSWAEQLDAYWCAHPVVTEAQDLDGVYAAVSITNAGAGSIVTDPLSVAMIYRAETDDFVAYSTSARLAARVTAPPGQEPERDLMGVAWLPFLGWIVGDRTGYVSSRVLPMSSYVEIAPSFGSRVRFANATPWASDLPSVESELVDLVHQDLTASVQSIAQLRAPTRSADITGGKDSRLVLALLLQEGLADGFTFRTAGYGHSPDAVVGGEIATRFRLAHDHPVPTTMGEEDFRRRLATHVFQTAGMFSAWEFKGGLSVSSTLKVTGCVGEALRTHFKKYPEMPTTEELRRQFYGRSALRSFSILKPDVAAELLDLLDAELVQRLDGGGSAPQDLADSFYWRYRNRRWFGTYEELGEAGRVFPLYSLVGLQAAFALGPTKRRQEFLHFAVMSRACPDLAKVPFADTGWSEKVIAGQAKPGDYSAAPVRHKGDGPAATQWRPQRLLDNLNVARDLLLDESSSRLFDIIDRKAVQGVLRDPARATQAVCRQLFGALAAAVWLSHTESRERISATPDACGPHEPERSGTAPTERHAGSRASLRNRILSRVSR